MITLDGLADDWTAAERLDFAGSGVPGYAIYGVSEADAFFFAIETDSVAIGQDTTIWLDTDLDRSTGYQIWGFTGGVEYNVNVAEDGSVALYTGGAGETFVAALNFAYSADGQFLEFEVQLNPVGEWNTTRITFTPEKAEYWLNGKKVVSFVPWSDDWNEKKNAGKWKEYPDYGSFKTGYIGLQDHSSPIWFKNIKIKRL